jgi:aminoglycoside/choline kinase family phosphotransferase
VPADLADVTPGWLTAALRQGGGPAGVEVVTLDARCIGADRGFTGVVARLRPTYRRGGVGGPASMVVKLPMAERDAPSSYRAAVSADPGATGRHFRRCAAEVFFYRDLAAGLGGGVLSPLYTAVDDRAHRVVLLLPDLAAARPGDALVGCSPEEVDAVLRSVAPLHAAWWARPAGRRPGWLPVLLTDAASRQERYRAQVDVMLARHGDTLPAPARATLLRLRNTLAGVLTGLAGAAVTVVHTDLHLDNVMFHARAHGPQAVILDWQGVAAGPAVVDLAGLVVGSLSPTQRRSAEGGLLHRYHTMLREHGVVGYGWQRLGADYRLAVLRHAAGLAGWAATADPTAVIGRERALLDAAFGDGRLSAALTDLA